MDMSRLVLRVVTADGDRSATQEIDGDPPAIWEELGAILSDPEFVRCEVMRFSD